MMTLFGLSTFFFLYEQARQEDGSDRDLAAIKTIVSRVNRHAFTATFRPLNIDRYFIDRSMILEIVASERRARRYITVYRVAHSVWWPSHRLARELFRFRIRRGFVT